MRRVQILVFGIACVSLILGTTLLVLEIVRPRNVETPGPFWQDFDRALSEQKYQLAWSFLRDKVPPVIDGGRLPHGTVSRLWDLWTVSKDTPGLKEFLSHSAPNINDEYSAKLSLLLLEAGKTEEAVIYFKPDRFQKDYPYLSDELRRISEPAKIVSSHDFAEFSSFEAGYTLDKAAAAAYLGDYAMAGDLLEQAGASASPNSDLIGAIQVQTMRLLWDLEDHDALEKLLNEAPFPDALARDASFVADLSTLGTERVRQAEVYHQLIAAGWKPSKVHAENMKLLEDYVAGALDILKDDHLEDDPLFADERAALMNPEKKDIRQIIAGISELAQEKQEPRMLRLALWYFFTLGDDKAFKSLLESKNLTGGSWRNFYQAVSLTDRNQALENLKSVKLGILGVCAQINRARILLLQGQIAKSGAELDTAMKAMERESRGLDTVYAGVGLDRPEPSTPYAILRADALALRSIIERLSGKPDRSQAALRELHDLDPGHPIFSRAGGVDLNAEDIFGPDTEEYYHDAPKE